MYAWTLTLLMVACSLLYLYYKKKLSYFKELGIPYKQGVPVFGNMLDLLLRRKHINSIALDIYNVHPDAKYVGAFDFSRPVIVLRDLELIKSVAIKNFEHFTDHRPFVDPAADPLFGVNLFSMKGDKWKETRNMLSPAFTSSKMKTMFELMLVCVSNAVDYLSELPAEARNMLDTKEFFTKYTNDVIASCAFGISVNSLKNPNNEFYKYGREATNFEGVRALKFFLVNLAPKLLKLLNIKLVDDKIASFFKKIVSDTIKMREETGTHRPDMLQLMMDARGKENNKHIQLDIQEMTAHAFIFFFAGFDSTSTQMCSLAHELAINPDVQEKLQSEIDAVLERCDGKVTYEAINSMVYLDAVFNEALRLHAQAGFTDRICTKAFELPPSLPGLEPITVQPGTAIWIPIHAIHRNPEYYKEPTKFDPERYYQKKITINDVYNLGFGIGPRGCIGNRFAILEIKTLFFFILAKFNLKPNEKTCSPLVYSPKSFCIKPEGGFCLALEPRVKAK